MAVFIKYFFPFVRGLVEELRPHGCERLVGEGQDLYVGLAREICTGCLGVSQRGSVCIRDRE